MQSGVASEPTVAVKMVCAAITILKSEYAVSNFIREREVKTVFDFDLSHPDTEDYEKTMLKIASTLTKSSTLDTVKGPDMRIHQHFEKIANSNSYDLIELSCENQADGKTNFNFTKVGNGMFAFASLFNHSCYPNVVNILVEGKLVFIVTRPIEANEQIFVSYGPTYSTADFSMRKKRLSHYGFDCDCIACANNYPLITRLPHCDSKLIAPKTPTATQDAIMQFKKNCDYINKHFALPPSFEVASLCEKNSFLLNFIGRRILNDSNVELESTYRHQ